MYVRGVYIQIVVGLVEFSFIGCFLRFLSFSCLEVWYVDRDVDQVV